ncbi:MAG: membrane protein insertase YidC [Myxococcales bacterium]|nr:membrane protein insertase YidC [Myxococcales bacterium]
MQDNTRRTLVLIVVAVAIGLLYYTSTELLGIGDSPASDDSAQSAGDTGETPTEPTGDGGDAGDGAPATHLSAEERTARRTVGTITTDHFRAEIDNLGGGITSFTITNDPRFTDEEGHPLDVLSTSTPGHERHGYDENENYESLRVEIEGMDIPDDAVWDLAQVSDQEVRLSWTGNGVRVVRSFRAGQGRYQLWHTVRIENLASYERTARLGLETWHWVERDDESGGIIARRSPATSSGVCVYGDDTERKDRSKLTEDGEHGYGSGDVHVAAVENVYFTQAMAAETDVPAARCSIWAQDRFERAGDEDPRGSLFRARLLYGWDEFQPGQERTYRTLAYLGPKDPDALNLAGHHLPQMIDLGFFALIANQLARLLGFIQGFVPNWGLAIILLTLLVRLTLFPLTNLSFASMAKMRRLKPEMERINELYKDDAEKKGAATMELYRKEKINPLAGCLPSLVQLPVWWALYTSLSTNIELYHMPFFGWLVDLSAPDPYYVLPLLLGALMHVQQRLSPTSMDPTQAKMMMYFMPIMITVFMLFLPSGLCLYMLTNSALGIGQMRLNEYRLQKEVEAPKASDPSDDDDDGDEDDAGSEDGSANSQKRRPRRKRRVRRGKA